jgi:hypothetical protein
MAVGAKDPLVACFLGPGSVRAVAPLYATEVRGVPMLEGVGRRSSSDSIQYL